MRKTAAILLFALYSFNLLGYQLLFFLLEQNAGQQLQASLDREDYQDADLITLKIPLSLPYITDRDGFERVDGEIVFDGTVYHFVKRTVKDGSLILLCLPDHQKMKLESYRQEFAKGANDFPGAHSSQKQKEGKSSLFKYLKAICHEKAAEADMLSGLLCSIRPVSYYCCSKVFSFSFIPERPPELDCTFSLAA